MGGARLGSEIEFPPFRLDLANESLHCGEAAVGLNRKAFLVLRHLAERAGRIVTKEELLDAVWADTHVGEAVLKVCIAEIRKATQDTTQAPRFIETIHRRGYRFIGKISSGVAPARGEGVAPIGREADLARLMERLDKARAGERQIVFVTGETGIGKTTLIDAFVEAAGEGGALTAHGQCLEQHGAGEPYFPVLEAMARLCRQPGGERVAETLRQYAPTWLAQIPSLITDADRDSLKREVLGAAKERMLREFAEAVEALTADTSLVLVLEDLHWSDYSTLDLIAQLGRRKERARLMVIGTYRPADIILVQHPLKGVKQELQIHGRCVELPLEFLGTTAVEQVLARRFAAHDFPEDLAGLLQQRTDGNPLFLVNVIDFMVESGTLALRDDRWQVAVAMEELGHEIPDTLQQMIQRQFERLSDTERRVLETAAVAGVEFVTGAVGAAMGMDAGDVDAACAVLEKRHQFVEAGEPVDVAGGSVWESFRFVHALYRHALYRGISASRRVELHRRIAHSLEAAFAERLESVAGELAIHFEGGRDYKKSIHYLRMAAERATRRYANRDAIHHLRKASELLERLPAEQRQDMEWGIVEQRGLAKRSMDDTRGAIADFALLVDNARNNGRTEEKVRALLRLSAVLFWENHDRCLATAERAVELSAELPNRKLHLDARAYLGSRRIRLRGWTNEDYRACVEAAEASRAAGDADTLGLHLMSLSFLESFRSEYRQACRAAEEGMAATLETGDAFHYVSCQYFKGFALLHLGDWGEALSFLSEGLRLSDKNGHGTASTLFRLVKASLHTQAFDFEGARDLALEARAQARVGFPVYVSLIVLGAAWLGLGEYEKAFDCFGEVNRRVEESPFRLDWIFNFPLHANLSRLWLATGDLAAARGEAETLLELSSMPRERTYMAIANQTLAEIALRSGDLAEARLRIGAAMSLVDGAEVPLAEWRVLRTAGEVALHVGDEHVELRRRSLAVLERMAQSVPEGHPLRKSLVGSAVYRELSGESSAWASA